MPSSPTGPTDAGHRRMRVLRGMPEDTAERARELIAALAPDACIWAGEGAPTGVVALSVHALGRALGRTAGAVVLDLHARLDVDALARAAGCVRGGGALIVRMPSAGWSGHPSLAAPPFVPEDAGQRLAQRLEEKLFAHADEAPISPAFETRGTPEQAALVSRLQARFAEERATMTAVLAPRGRGKSAALGLALAGLRHDAVLTAGDVQSASEVRRFAGGDLDITPVEQLIAEGTERRIVVVDEAAQLPVPILRQLVSAVPHAHLAFATTTHGYEGTGRGFVLRFLAELEDEPRTLFTERLETPIRFAPGDPLEHRVHDALLLDTPLATPRIVASDEVRAVSLDRDALAADEARLRAFFGLLLHAHYRTVPSDLHRMLDAPNLSLHALVHRDEIVAATWTAAEGGLDEVTLEDVYLGRRRLRGHALAESLVGHLGEREAGALPMTRSVRIAVHPAYRRRGLGRKLADHVHAASSPALFGTLFGATPGLLAFRRAQGYRVVRIGASRGARTGEPSVMMIRPTSERAEALTRRLRAGLARDLDAQLGFLEEGGLALEPALRASLAEGLERGLGDDPAWDAERCRAYAHGPRTFESVATSLGRFVRAHGGSLAALGVSERALLEARVVERAPWSVAAARAGLPSVPAAMRATRRAFRALYDASASPRSGA